jgi:putative phosphoribosyl transferase
MTLPFADRAQAGHELAERLAARAWSRPLAVLALPRGGVPLGAVIARRLDAPLDLLIVRKIGAPRQRELAVAALVDGSPPDLVVDERLCAELGIERAWLEDASAREAHEIARRRRIYLEGRAAVPVQDATVIVVDDGIATGTTMRAALRGLQRRGAAHVVLAVPVAPTDTLAALAAEVDEVVCLAQPTPFGAISRFYIDFHQVSDAEVLDALREAAEPPA